MGIGLGGFQGGGGSSGAASSLSPGATGADLTLSSTDTALQFISTQTTGLDGYKVTANGVQWHVGIGANDFFSSNGSTITFAGPIASLNAVTGVTVTAALTQGFALGGNLVLFDGTAAAQTAGQEYLRSQVADGASAVGFTVCNANALTTAGAHIQDFKAGTFNSATVASVDKDGQYIGTSFTDDSGTTGSRTVNKVRGFNAFAAAATAITITNSFAALTSQINCVLMTNDATALIKNVVPAAGSFTITLNAAATGTTKVAWQVVN